MLRKISELYFPGKIRKILWELFMRSFALYQAMPHNRFNERGIPNKSKINGFSDNTE